VSLPGQNTNKLGPSKSRAPFYRLYFLLGFYPDRAVSYFFTFSVDGSDSVSMEQNGPMLINTRDLNCTVVLPDGAVAYSGTTAGSLIRWNIRYFVRFSAF